MQPYPLIFEPILKPKVWGGRYLEHLGKRLPPPDAPDALIGESWEIADLPTSIPAGRSVIANGPLAGQTLHDAIETHAEAILGSAPRSHAGRFPLLIKYLDARENLSVQVHPDEDYVRKHPEAHLKYEAWYIVHAEPGAVIYKGIREGVTAEQFARDIETGDVAGDLIAVPARPGDLHYLPSGTCHALGAGIVVAEIQTPSDTTFRVYDWGRTDREMHIEQALQCMHLPGAHPPAEARPSRQPIELESTRSTPLLSTDYFEIERLEITQDTQLPITPATDQPEIWMVLAGGGAIETPGNSEARGKPAAESLILTPGTTVLIPARIENPRAKLTNGTTTLRVTLPSPIKHMLA